MGICNQHRREHTSDGRLGRAEDCAYCCEDEVKEARRESAKEALAKLREFLKHKEPGVLDTGADAMDHWLREQAGEVKDE